MVLPFVLIILYDFPVPIFFNPATNDEENLMNKFSLAAAISATALRMTAHTANAGALLSADAQAAGFQLNTFVSNIPTPYIVGPTGIVNTADGHILLTDHVTGQIRSFSDTDNQVWTNGNAAATNYGPDNSTGLARVGGNYYLAEQSNGKVVQVNADGSYRQDIVAIGDATGIIGNAANGHLYVSTVAQVFDVNPLTKTFSLFNTITADGLSLSPDGSTLYMADRATNHILGFNTGTNAQVFDSGFVAGQVDGTALGSGSLAGNLFVNTNDGTLVEVNLATHIQSLIFSGGSRGDFVSVDTNNDSLLITQTDSVLRLTAPSGGGFTSASVPEPSSLALFSIGLAGFAGVRRGRKTQGVAV
jgi:sugar lactone lactonase YvrE